jgi:hypothetical protein
MTTERPAKSSTGDRPGIYTWGDLFRRGFFREPAGGHALWLILVPAVLFLIQLPRGWQIVVGATLVAAIGTAVALWRRHH